MIYKENEEEHAVKIITDYLKEEKNIQIKNARKLTSEEGEPPDCYFEIGDHKIGCEVEHFHVKGADNNLAKESAIIRKIGERTQRCLEEKGIPVLALSFDLTPPPTEVHKNVETIVKIITIMYNDSVTDSNEYKRSNREKYYELFIENNINDIRFLYRDQLGLANTDEKCPYLLYGISSPDKTIKVEEMRDVIKKKDKDIPIYKEQFDEKWLIITNYGTMDFFILKDAAEEAQYKCNFDNVLYIEWRGIEPKPHKQRRTGSLTDEFAVYELKVGFGQD